MSAPSKPIQATDSSYAVETPEGVRIHFECAGPFPRMAATMIDFLIQGLIMIVFSMGIGFLGAVIGFSVAQGLQAIFVFLMMWFYYVFFEVYRNGQTPGKKVFHLQVMDVRGTPITLAKSILRNLLRIADFLPFVYGFGLLSILNTSRFQRLGDLVAGTIVVYVPQAQTPFKAPQSITPRQPPFPLTLEEQRAIIAFTERQNVIPGGLSEELAAHLKELTKHNQASASETLYAYGAWLAGGRP
ncbi:RDD family protein [Acanthopleuribacter pedis]|uniref:RDD family protein n=1 Tax=Acanthopleuribacter pedis TaxID=442870 RepID=A0A8J7Q9A1_9BACT|nr:RDD family protein [Acanthopleuribacter pedis]MBO1320250.1 RDD family protein [Acanthopleuribacter pedis]